MDLRLRVTAALKFLFGDISSEGEIATVKKQAEEIKSHLATEHKLQRVIECLRQLQGDDYFEDLTKAAEYCKEHFFDVNSVFILSHEIITTDPASYFCYIIFPISRFYTTKKTQYPDGRCHKKNDSI